MWTASRRSTHLLEGLAQALLERALELLVHGCAHLLELLLVLFLQRLEASVDRAPHVLEALLDRLAGVAHGAADLLAQVARLAAELGAAARELLAQHAIGALLAALQLVEARSQLFGARFCARVGARGIVQAAAQQQREQARAQEQQRRRQREPRLDERERFARRSRRPPAVRTRRPLDVPPAPV